MVDNRPFFERVPLEVSIPTSETITGPDGKPFTVYCVRIAHTNLEGEIVSWRAVHKFAHLLNLHDKLRGKYPTEMASLKFPKPISRLDVAEQEFRKNGLQTYLQMIVDTPVLRVDESVKTILLLRERNFTSKYQTMRTKGRRAQQDGEPSSTQPRNCPSPSPSLSPSSSSSISPPPSPAPSFSPSPSPTPPSSSRPELGGRMSKSKSDLSIGNQRQKFVEDVYGTYPRKSKGPLQLDEVSNLSDTEIEKILLNNTRHPSNLGPLLRHYIASQPTKVVVEEAPEVVSIPVIMKTVGKSSYTPLKPMLQKKIASTLPKILVQSTEYILRSGVDLDTMMKSVPTEGAAKVQNILKSFDKGFSVVFKNLQDAVGCFFAFLMSIPAPLMSYEMHPYFISIAEEEMAPEVKLEECRILVSMLQSAQFDMLKFMLDFLFQIAQRSKFLPAPMEQIGNIVVQLVFGSECCESEFELANKTSQFMVQNFLKIFY